MTRNCLNCNSEFEASNRDINAGKAKFCSGTCHKQFQRKEYIKRWKDGLENGDCKGTISKHIRKYLFEKYHNKCAKCEWSQINKHTGKIPLEVDHIDGNHLNNSENNLTLLCPNCHSLTPTYKGANKGGRDRKKYKSRY